MFSHADEVLTELIIDGEWVETTPEHPFYVEGKGWTDAEDLQMGDQVRQADGTTGTVWLKWNVHKMQEMYNLTVATAHTFFVGEGQWLVHNAGCWDVGDQIDKVDEAGNYPDWDTVRSRYWQNRAATSSGEFGPQNLALMANGYAPVARIIAQVKKTGATVEKLVTKDLHHISGRNIRNPHNINNLAELWPWEHAARDPFRRLDYKFLRFK